MINKGFQPAIKNTVDKIYLKPGVPYTAKVFASDPNNDPLNYIWAMLKEVIRSIESQQ